MRLYLVQHGSALPKETDPERRLSDQGRADVQRMADLLGRAGVRIDQLYHSGKPRAAQTAEILAATLLTSGAPEPLAGLDPKDPPSGLDKIRSTWRRDTLVVGHLPFLAHMVSRLVCGVDSGRVAVGYQPGTLVCLEQDEDGAWVVAWMLRPDLLSAMQ